MNILKDITKDDINGSPDLEYIVKSLTEIFEFISKDEIMKLKDENKLEYDKTLTLKFPEFSDRYFSLFSVILSGELDSMTHLVLMIKTLGMVKAGKISMDTAYAQIREELSNQYIYPQFGGKEKFEETVRNRHKKGKRKLPK